MFSQLFGTTSEYQRLAGALGTPGAAALFGLPGAGRAQMYAALQKALNRPLCIVTPGEAEATRFAADLNTLGIAAAVFPARDYVLRPIESTAREIMKTKRELYEILAAHSGVPIRKIEKDADRDYWLSAREARDYGLIDEVLTKREKKTYGTETEQQER